MYQPRPRPKKTSITRTRSGCYSCRERRRKCDEVKPECLRCQRAKRRCGGYEPRYTFLDVTTLTAGKNETSQAKGRSRPTQPDQVQSPQDLNTIDLSWTSPNSTPMRSDIQNIATHVQGIESTSRRVLRSDSRTLVQSWCQVSSAKRLQFNAQHNRAGIQVHYVKPTIEERHSVQQPSLGASPPTDILEHKAYHEHFRNVLASRLPSTYLPSIEKLSHLSMVETALLALSASSMAHADGRFENRSHTYAYRSSPQSRKHFAEAFELYSQALELLHDINCPSPQEPEARLLTIMLAILFEWQSGSAKAIRAHLRGATAIAVAEHRAISLTDSGQLLICAWAEFHTTWEAHMLPFRPVEMEKTISVPRLLAQNFADRRVAVQLMFTDAIVLSRRLLLAHCMGDADKDMAVVMVKVEEWYRTHVEDLLPTDNIDQAERDIQKHSIESFLTLIPPLKLLLRTWHDSMPVEDLPCQQSSTEALLDQPLNVQHQPFWLHDSTPISEEPRLGLEPLVFKSCAVARGYLYCSAAQALLSDENIPQFSEIAAKSSTEQRSTENFDTYHSRPVLTPVSTPSTNKQPMTNFWANLVLRVLAGIDWTDEASSSSYQEHPIWILWTVCNTCLDISLVQRVLYGLFPWLLRKFPAERSLQSAIATHEPLFRVLLGKLLLGWKPYLITSPTPGSQEMGADQAELVVTHGLNSNGDIVHVTERLPIG